MPVVCSIEKESRLAVLRYTDPYSMADWDDALDAILAGPTFDRTFNFLVDRRAVAPPTREFAEHVGAYLRRHSDRLAGRRVAIVTASPGGYGMARVQQVFNETAGLPDTQVFFNEDQARAWLASASEPG